MKMTLPDYQAGNFNQGQEEAGEAFISAAYDLAVEMGIDAEEFRDRMMTAADFVTVYLLAQDAKRWGL